MKVYIASAGKYIGKVQEDIYIRDKFRSIGLVAEISNLSDIVKRVIANDLVILKSIWGYYLNYMEFIQQIRFLEKRGVKLINDYKYLYWNIDKSKYLPEVDFIGTVPTQIINLAHCSSLLDVEKVVESIILENAMDNIFVIKPTISASGFLTFIYSRNSKDKGLFSVLFDNKERNFLIQPFRSQLIDGEISVIVLNGKPLYGIRRFPGVLSSKHNPEYVNIKEVPKDILKKVEILLLFLKNKFNSVSVINRIDFIKNGLSYELMEIELIDPDLFFKYIPEEILKECLSELCQYRYVCT